MTEQIENYIDGNLSGQIKQTALDFVKHLKENGLTFYRDTCDCWKNKIYYWIKLGEKCVCFMAIADPDEPGNLWTVWSDDCKAYENASISDDIKNTAWKYVNCCGNCGSCGGGKEKVIFGKKFLHVCGCNFRIDNAVQDNLPFLKIMVDLRVGELLEDAVINHYDILIDENNDPVHDPQPLQDYMNKWDGQGFIDKMELDKNKSVLEIGVGTGRLATKTAPLSKEFYGIDLSPKTIQRAKENLVKYKNVTLICDDFFNYQFDHSFDVVYSSLTFMHIRDKQRAINKIAELLNNTGKFILSIDKNQNDFIDTGTNKIKIYPDTSEMMERYIKTAGLVILEKYETEFATIFVANKNSVSQNY